ncbi:hypothetical protein HYH02_007233 [Chlamydomonas schloesseri]|uniref:Uncharacterized protein n=1 Tax=Chlamydomonas schloesseri TaxID=2026947 RepID=A0A835WI00_9CHLO|nr:hypothetical protein HYH02_007233 [Chlamydomonas schloesseri]|eukprot:KAG2447776.1 hypothetical protein HYH02_007233 [Chlamydomonas schloesseri]
MRHLEKELGVRFIAGGGEGDEDEEEELDDWEDVVAELGNPLDMRPARVGLMDDDDDLGFGLNPAAELAAAVAAADGSGGAGEDDDEDDDGRLPLPPLPAAAAAAAAAAATAQAGASGAGVGASAYLDPSALPRVGRGELLQLAAHGGSAPGKAAVALLDVREAAEVAAAAAAPRADGGSSTTASSSAGGCGGGGGGGCGGGCNGGGAAATTSLAPWGSRQQHVEVRHVPLGELRRPQAEALAAAADYVAVAATGDHRGEQAVVRLGRVYGLRRVVLYDEAEE